MALSTSCNLEPRAPRTASKPPFTPVKVAWDCSLTDQTDINSPPASAMQRSGDGGRERVLAQALENEAQDGHTGASAVTGVVYAVELLDILELPEHLASVTDEQQGGAIFAARLPDEGQRLAGVLVVEIAGRLIRQHQLGLIGQGSRDGDPLLLAAGELPGIVCQPMAQADALQEFFCQIAVGPRSEGHAEQHVFEAGVALQEIEGLEDVADGRCPQAVAGGFVEGGHLLAGKDNPAGIRLENSGNQVEESGLAGAAFALQGHLGLFGEGEGLHVDDAMVRAIRGEEGLFEIRDFEQHHRREVRAPGPGFAGEEPPGRWAKTFYAGGRQCISGPHPDWASEPSTVPYRRGPAGNCLAFLRAGRGGR